MMNSRSVSTQSVEVTDCGEWHIATKSLLNNIKTASSNQISSLRVVWQDGCTHHCLGAEVSRQGARFTDAGLRQTWQNHISPCWGKSILLVKTLCAMPHTLADAGGAGWLLCLGHWNKPSEISHALTDIAVRWMQSNTTCQPSIVL